MKITTSFISLILFTSLLYAQTAGEIIKKAEETIKGKTASGIIEMTVETPDYTRVLRMESWWEGNEKALITVKSPKKEEGNKTLKIGNEMWTYLRNTETTIKIPPSMMLQSWNGSDFTNDDIVRESNVADDYFQNLLGQDSLEGDLCWKIELIPKPDAPVVWGKLYYWVRKEDYTPAMIEYYDEKGKLIRHMSLSEIEKMGGRRIPTKWQMFNELKKGHSTIFKIIEMQFDIDIPERIFSFQELERGN